MADDWFETFFQMTRLFTSSGRGGGVLVSTKVGGIVDVVRVKRHGGGRDRWRSGVKLLMNRW